MSIDVVTLALAKAYADELVANGGDPEKTEQIIRDKIDEVLGSIGGGADWAVNDETAAGYIKNRTHGVLEKIQFPQDDSTGNPIYWDGPTGNEVLGTDYIQIPTPGELDCYSYWVSKDTILTLEEMLKIKPKDVTVYYTEAEEEFDTPFITLEDTQMELIVQELVDGKLLVLSSPDGMPFIISALEDNLSYVNSESNFTIQIKNKGIAFCVYSISEEILLKTVRYSSENVKQLDLKYIPEVAFGELILNDYGNYSTLKYTDRNGNVQQITIHDGPAGPAYTLTESDKSSIKSSIYSDIMGGYW